MKKLITLFLTLVCIFSLGGCGTQEPQEQREDAESDILTPKDLTPTPTPTLAPGQNQALPTTMIDSEIYFMSGMYSTVKTSEKSRIKELIEQAEYLGETTYISVSEYPKEELESNCFTEGSKVYCHQVGEKVNFIIVPPNELTYNYVSGWHKYQWFEGKLIDAGEQAYNKTGMPTPTPTVTP